MRYSLGEDKFKQFEIPLEHAVTRRLITIIGTPEVFLNPTDTTTSIKIGLTSIITLFIGYDHYPIPTHSLTPLLRLSSNRFHIAGITDTASGPGVVHVMQVASARQTSHVA